MAAVVYDGLCTFEFAIVAEIFALPRPEMGTNWYRFSAVAAEEGPLRANGGLTIGVTNGLDRLDEADLIVLPGWKGPDIAVPQVLIDALIRAHKRGARLASICSGAFVLAATGLLDGRRAATHWRYAEQLKAAFPAVEVDPSVLYVEEDRLLTSAGSAAGIDLMLHVIRCDLGPEAANRIARRLVVQPHRSGGQAQFVERPVAKRPESRLAPLLDRVRAEPTAPWSVASMAREAAMSERSFHRRFVESVGTTPGEWLTSVRVDEAKRQLEIGALSIEEVARLAGFGSIAALRYHLASATGLSPSEYRNRFTRRGDSRVIRDREHRHGAGHQRA